MNLLARVLQVLLGLWLITGGAYFTQNYAGLVNTWASDALPSLFWMIFGIVEVLIGLSLVISVAKKCRKWAVGSAVAAAIFVLLGLAFFTAYSGFPGMLWGIVPAVLLLFVAQQRAQN